MALSCATSIGTTSRRIFRRAAVWQTSRWDVVSSIPVSSGLQAVAAQGQLVQATSTDGHVVVLTANKPVKIEGIAASQV